MAERPFVTIVIPSNEDEARIEAALRTALTQDYPADRTEIIVADAMSMDATREIALRVAGGDPRVSIVDNVDRTRAAGLNAALAAAKGEIIVPIDPPADYVRTHVTKCVDALGSSAADLLAIVPRTAGRTLVERAISAAQTTRLAFASGTDLARGVEPVPTILGAARKEIFARVGPFDGGAVAEEEVDLSRRVTHAGGSLTVRRDIVVHRAEASSFRQLFRKHFKLGESRARRAVRNRNVGSVREVYPFAIVVGGGALALSSAIQPITPLALAAYALYTGSAAARLGQTEGLITIPIAWASYPVMHVAHGVGFAAGLVRTIRNPDAKPKFR